MCPSPAAFAIGLGPTNPWLTIIAKETLVFRRPDFSSGFVVTCANILASQRSTPPHG